MGGCRKTAWEAAGRLQGGCREAAWEAAGRLHGRLQGGCQHLATCWPRTIGRPSAPEEHVIRAGATRERVVSPLSYISKLTPEILVVGVFLSLAFVHSLLPPNYVYTYSDARGALGRHATVPAFRGSYRAPPGASCPPGAVSIYFIRSNDPLNASVSCHLPRVFGSPVLNHPISPNSVSCPMLHSHAPAAARDAAALFAARAAEKNNKHLAGSIA